MAERDAHRCGRAALVGLAAICVIASVPRLIGLGSRPIWLDEAYTHWYATRTLAYLWGTVPSFESHPPLYYSLMKLVVLASDRPFWLRVPSVLCSLALLPMVFAIARELIAAPRGADRADRPGWLSLWMALAWLALSGTQIAFAQEARPYSALCLAVAAMLWAGVRAIRRWPELLERRAGWAAFAPELAGLAIGAGLTLWLHNVGAFFVIAVMAPLGAWALSQRQRWRCLLLLAGAMALAALIYAPYLPHLLRRADDWSNASWMATLTGYRAGVVVEESLGLHGLSGDEWTRRRLLLAVIGLVSVGLLACWRRVGPWQAVLVAGAAGLPVLMLAVTSMAVAPIFAARTLLPVGIPVALLVGLAVDLPRAGAPRWLGSLAVLGFLLLSAGWGYDSRQDEPWDQVATMLRAQVRPDDALLLFTNEVALPLQYYLGEDFAGLPVTALPRPFPALGLDDPYPFGTPSVPGLTASDIDAMLAATRSAGSVWLLVRVPEGSPYLRMLRLALDTQRPLLEERHLYDRYMFLLHWGPMRPVSIR